MSKMQKLYKKYERHFLLGLVLILLATFSIAGAFTGAGGGGEGTSLKMGGEFKIGPSETTSIDDEEFDKTLARYNTLSSALPVPSREFRGQLYGMPPSDRSAIKPTWRHLVTLEAAKAAGYYAGELQTNTALKELVDDVLRSQSMQYSDVLFQEFLKRRRISQKDFRAGVADVVVKDQFLYPIISSTRYQVTYEQAFDKWKSDQERVALQYYALPAAPFADQVRKEEATRKTIYEQERMLTRLTNVSASVARVLARVEDVKKKSGAYPEALADIRAFRPAPDSWGTELRYTLVDGTPDVRSAGPDKVFDTADDVTAEAQKQLLTHGDLFALATKLRVRRNATDSWPKKLDELLTSPGGDRLPGLAATTKDGWDQDFVYTPGADEKAEPSLASIGPDGSAGTADDIKLVVGSETIELSPGPGLAPFLLPALKDAWGIPMKVTMSRSQPASWRVTSSGLDGDMTTSDDNLVSGNQREIEAFFRARARDYVQKARIEFETLFTHLPLVSDEAMRRLWEAYPQHRPTDEEALFTEWRSYRDDTFYSAEDPRDPETGHGAELLKKIAPKAKLVLVPAKDIFPEVLSQPTKKDDGSKGDPKKDEKKDEKKDDAGAVEGPVDDAAKKAAEAERAARESFTKDGWREIMIRQKFFERLLNDILTRARDSGATVAKAKANLAAWERRKAAADAAIAAWEKEHKEGEARPEAFTADKPVVPEEVTFETTLAGELGDMIASGDADTPPAIQYWKTPKPMTREEHEENVNFSKGLQFVLNRLKSDGDYLNVPAQLHTRLTKVLVRRLSFEDQRLQTLEEVEDAVFDSFVEERQIERAAQRLGLLQDAMTKAVSELDDEATDEAKAKAEADAYKTWLDASAVKPTVETTPLFMGAKPPPPLDLEEDASEDEKARAGRLDFIWRAGYESVRGDPNSGDKVSSEPGTFGRTVLKDPKRDEDGTGNAYLVRVAERVFPTKHEFSPAHYREHLHREVFGVQTRRRRPGADAPTGRMTKALARWYTDMEWLQRKFDLETNSPLDKGNKGSGQ